MELVRLKQASVHRADATTGEGGSPPFPTRTPPQARGPGLHLPLSSLTTCHSLNADARDASCTPAKLKLTLKLAAHRHVSCNQHARWLRKFQPRYERRISHQNPSSSLLLEKLQAPQGRCYPTCRLFTPTPAPLLPGPGASVRSLCYRHGPGS